MILDSPITSSPGFAARKTFRLHWTPTASTTALTERANAASATAKRSTPCPIPWAFSLSFPVGPGQFHVVFGGDPVAVRRASAEILDHFPRDSQHEGVRRDDRPGGHGGPGPDHAPPPDDRPV